MTSTGTGARCIWVSGRPIVIWENPEATFSWTPRSIQSYARADHWESVFNALVLLGDSDPKGMA
jgi:hypothetical protein